MNAQNGKETITLRTASPNEKERWDSLVESSPHGTVFHTWDWVSAMARHSRMRLLKQTLKPVFHPLIAEHDGKDIGLIPLYEFKGALLSYVFSPPPHTLVTYLGPCLNIPDNLNKSTRERLHRNFQNAVDEYITRLGPDCTRIRPPPGFEDARPYLWLDYEVTPLYNYVIDLKHPIDEVFKQGEASFRNKVRRTEKEGYTVRKGAWGDLVKLYDQQKSRYGEQGIPMAIDLEYLEELWANAPPGRLNVFVIELKDEYVTASLEVSYKGRMLGWMGNPKGRSTAGSPNDLLMWEVIKYSINRGLGEYENIWANEERLNPFKTKLNPGLNRYYSAVKMNPTLSLVYQVKKSVLGGKVWGAGL